MRVFLPTCKSSSVERKLVARYHFEGVLFQVEGEGHLGDGALGSESKCAYLPIVEVRERNSE